MENILVPLILDYPTIKLWDREITANEKLKIINAGDFPLGDVLDGIGIGDSGLKNSFGVTNAEEIKNRLELAKFLDKNPDFRGWIKEVEVSSLEFPFQEDSFLKYFDPKKDNNPFWEKINEFISMLSLPQTPARLQIVRDFFKSAFGLAELEKKMGAIMTEKIEGMAVIEGTMSLLIKGDDDRGVYWMESIREHAHGYQKYSSSIVNIKMEPYPEWINNKWNPVNWIGLGKRAKVVVDAMNNKKVEEAYRAMLITGISESLKTDITNGVRKILEDSRKKGGWNFSLLTDIVLHVYFVYNRDGLNLRFYGIEPRNEMKMDFCHPEFRGCTEEHGRKIEEAREEMSTILRQNGNSLLLCEMRKRLHDKFPFLFGTGESFKVDSIQTDMKHKWFAIENLYNSYFLKDCYMASCRIRDFFENQVKTLKQVTRVIEQLSLKAAELKTTICYPEILEDGHHVVSFKEIFPVHLLSRIEAKDIVPIRSLPVLNGQMLGLTGYHGGGKTVTSLAVVTNIFLAQSGLPVFGKGFRLNVKDILGMMFVERGTGSTCELLLDKIVKILKEIKDVHNSKVVLVLDEVGTGTQEMDGYKLGKDILSKLSEMGVSVLFSTQIQSLAEFARKELDAQCFKVDEKHNLTPGIGKGGMDSLRVRKGLDVLLR